MPRRRWLIALLGLLVGLAGCATNPVTQEQDFVLMSEERELELGEELHPRILKQFDVYDDEALQDYVSRLGQEVAANSHRSDIDYTFTVLDSPQVNAFALPGGYIYITRGIMAYFDSEAELVGVLGHELGHVTARHSVQQYSANMATSILGGILLSASDAGRAGARLFQTVQLAAMRGYSREHELQADRLGAQYLARTGYDSEAMLGVVRILADQEAYERQRAQEEGREPRTYHGVFSTHPDNDQRRQEVIREAKAYEVESPRPDGRRAYLRMLDGMPFGAGTSQGKVVDHRFLHLELDAALEAPPEWTIENRPEKLIFRAPDEAALLEVTLGGVEDGTDARTLLKERAGRSRLERGRRFEAHGFDGYTAVARAASGRGAQLIRRVVVIKDGRAWYFAGASRKPDAFDRFDEAFLDIAGSLHRLTPAEREAAQPLRLRIVEADADTTYADLAQGVDGIEDPVGRLRLLNGDWPDGEPEAGRLIKAFAR